MAASARAVWAAVKMTMAARAMASLLRSQAAEYFSKVKMAIAARVMASLLRSQPGHSSKACSWMRPLAVASLGS